MSYVYSHIYIQSSKKERKEAKWEKNFRSSGHFLATAALRHPRPP